MRETALSPRSALNRSSVKPDKPTASGQGSVRLSRDGQDSVGLSRDGQGSVGLSRNGQDAVVLSSDLGSNSPVGGTSNSRRAFLAALSGAPEGLAVVGLVLYVFGLAPF